MNSYEEIPYAPCMNGGGRGEEWGGPDTYSYFITTELNEGFASG